MINIMEAIKRIIDRTLADLGWKILALLLLTIIGAIISFIVIVLFKLFGAFTTLAALVIMWAAYEVSEEVKRGHK